MGSPTTTTSSLPFWRSIPWEFYLTDAISKVVYESIESIGLHVLNRMLGHKKYPRSFVKVFVGKGVSLEAAQKLTVKCPTLARRAICEALIPVPHHSHIAAIAYYGWTDERIIWPKEVMNAERDMMQTITARVATNTRALPEGYTVDFAKTNQRWEKRDVNTVRNLYSLAFPNYVGGQFTMRSTRSLLNNNWSMVIRNERGTIIAIALMDISRFTNDHGCHFAMADITEVVVNRQYRGNGLGDILYRESIAFLFNHGFDLVYSECRSACAGIIRSAHNAGMNMYGLLPAHIECNSPVTNVTHDKTGDADKPYERYENLWVFAITRP